VGTKAQVDPGGGADARRADAGSLGTEVPQHGPGAEPLVGVGGGQSPRKWGLGA